jgi:hypothetical protein
MLLGKGWYTSNTCVETLKAQTPLPPCRRGACTASRIPPTAATDPLFFSKPLCRPYSTCKCVYFTRTCGQDSASSRQSSSLTELSDSSTPRSTALPAFFQLPLLPGNANSKPSRQHAQRFPGTGTPLVQHTNEGNPNLPSPSTLQPLTHKSTCRKVQGSAHKTTHSARSATGLTTLAGERQLKLCTARAAVLVLSTEQQLCDP